MKQRKFVIGDVHGGYKALIQVLERAHFDYEQDMLYTLGDLVDGWPETPEVIEELMKIKHLQIVIGNHDQWCIDWMTEGATPLVWTTQGGQATLDAYVERRGDLITKHRDEFWSKGSYVIQDEQLNVFVHGGIPRPNAQQLYEAEPMYFMWDRDLAELVMKDGDVSPWGGFNAIYLGHTTTTHYSDRPINKANIWCMDTGGGWEGKVSMMNIDSKEVFQSDVVKTLYPAVRGRN